MTGTRAKLVGGLTVAVWVLVLLVGVGLVLTRLGWTDDIAFLHPMTLGVGVVAAFALALMPSTARLPASFQFAVAVAATLIPIAMIEYVLRS